MTLSVFREISDPVDFKRQVLANAGQSYFSDYDTVPFAVRRNFLEIASLEGLKSLQKQGAIERTRRKFYTMVLLTSGSVKETIGYSTFTLEAGTLYFIPENQLHTIHRWSDDVKGYHCIFDVDYFLLCLKHQVKLNEYPFFQSTNEPFVRLPEEGAVVIGDLFRKLSVEYHNRKTFNDDLLVRLYLNVLLIEAERIYRKQNDGAATNLPRKEQLVAKFKQLVSRHFIEYRQVSDYAKLLFVNPHYLNDTVKEVTGSSASSFIYNQLIAEAKAYLIQTTETTAAISEQLNFKDQSYFSRFFKKHTGITPIQFRNEHRH